MVGVLLGRRRSVSWSIRRRSVVCKGLYLHVYRFRVSSLRCRSTIPLRLSSVSRTLEWILLPLQSLPWWWFMSVSTALGPREYVPTTLRSGETSGRPVICRSTTSRAFTKSRSIGGHPLTAFYVTTSVWHPVRRRSSHLAPGEAPLFPT